MKVKYTLGLSVIAIFSLAEATMAADDLASAFKEGNVTGDLRSYYINKTFLGDDYSRDGLAVGGKLGFITAPVSGISAGALLYSTNKVDSISPISKENDKTLFNSNDKGYTYVGELYLNYQKDNTVFKIGRQRLDTPLIGSDDDARMLPSLFEAAIFTNTDISDTKIMIGLVTRIAYGTLSNAFGPSAYNLDLSTSITNKYPAQKLGTQALAYGYGAIYDPSKKNNGYHGMTAQIDYQNGDFQSMSGGAFGGNVDQEGVTMASIIYEGVPHTKLQLWDYYLQNLFNTLYAQGDYSWNCLLNPVIKMTASVQYMQQNGIGNNEIGTVDSKYYGFQLQSRYQDLQIQVGYSATGSNLNATNNGGVIAPWGGMNSFTYTQSTRDQYFSDTKSYKLSIGYDFKKLTSYDFEASASHAEYMIGTENDFIPGTTWTAKETDLDIKYNVESVKNLQVWLRSNYQRNFAPATATANAVNNNEYRLEVNYKF
jgi:hypothetical protein